MGGIQLALHADDVIYVRDYKSFTRKVLEIRNKYMAGYKISHYKLVVYIYTNNNHPEKEIASTLLFVTTSKKITHLRINLTKEVKGLYKDVHKPLNRGERC